MQQQQARLVLRLLRLHLGLAVSLVGDDLVELGLVVHDGALRALNEAQPRLVGHGHIHLLRDARGQQQQRLRVGVDQRKLLLSTQHQRHLGGQLRMRRGQLLLTSEHLHVEANAKRNAHL